MNVRRNAEWLVARLLGVVCVGVGTWIAATLLIDMSGVHLLVVMGTALAASVLCTIGMSLLGWV